MLFDRATTAAYLGGAYLIGPHGELLASQSNEVDNNVRLADRDYFLAHQRSPAVGLYFSHPEARYFMVGRVGRDQVEDYARRKNMRLEEAERWLAPNLAYAPEGQAVVA